MIDELYNDYNKYSDFYDIFNKYRNYNREMRFILNIVKNKKWILDVGCGTGIHLNILENLGYKVNGLDINENMINIAKERVSSDIYKGNILDFKLNNKYDAIISIHSVFNHLKSYDEFEKALLNCLDHLNKNGILLIDLDNRRSNEDIDDLVDGNKRHMECFYSDKYNIQIRTITFKIGLKEFIFEHEYFIYDIKKIEKILEKNKLSYLLLTNYSKQKMGEDSNRIHIVIKKG